MGPGVASLALRDGAREITTRVGRVGGGLGGCGDISGRDEANWRLIEG